jgi:hypothetical protein
MDGSGAEGSVTPAEAIELASIKTEKTRREAN